MSESLSNLCGYLERVEEFTINTLHITHMRNTSRTDEDKLRNDEERYRATKREFSLQFEPAEFRWKEALQ